MALKTQWQQNAHRALRLMGRFYRWIGWFGLGVTAFVMVYGFISHWNDLGRGFGVDTYTRLWSSLFVAGTVMVIGLFACGMAFLVSLFIEVGSRMMENSLLQTDLLQRLVREQSDHEASVPSRLIENDTEEDDLTLDAAYQHSEHR